MANVINRTTKQYLRSVNTPKYPVALWIINPDMSEVQSTPKEYWKISGDLVLEMTSEEKAVVNAANLIASVTVKESQLKGQLFPNQNLVSTLVITAVPTGLVIDINSSGLDISDQITVVADVSLTKYVKTFLIYNSTTDGFTFETYEKTDGSYLDIASDEYVLAIINEWQVLANDTEMTEL